MKFSIGNLYKYKFEENNYNFLPILEWNEKDNAWTLKLKNEPYLKVENSSPCIYIGKTNSVSIGAFLLEDKIVGIKFDSIYEK